MDNELEALGYYWAFEEADDIRGSFVRLMVQVGYEKQMVTLYKNVPRLEWYFFSQEHVWQQLIIEAVVQLKHQVDNKAWSSTYVEPPTPRL